MNSDRARNVSIPMPTWTPFAVALLLLTTSANAQQGPPAPAIAEGLTAADAAGRAWGAYEAARTRATGHDAHLVRMLADPGPFDPMAKRIIRQHVLDALIRCNVKVPAATLLPHRRLFPTHALIIASRDPVTHHRVIHDQFMGSRSDVNWVAAGGILVARRAPGVAATLLSKLSIDISISVTDGSPTWRSSGGGGSSIGCGSLTAPDGFPPLVTWKLRRGRAVKNAVSVTEGRHPINAHRHVHDGKSIGTSSHSRLEQREKIRRDWILDLLGDDATEVNLELQRGFSIDWTNAAACKAAVRLHRAAVREDCAEVVRRLHRKALLTDEERERAFPRVTLKVHDDREDKSSPLPVFQ